MTAVDVLEIVREGMWTVLLIAGPIMIIGLIVGVLISLFQALTQIQEATLAYIPKIVAIFVSLVIFGPFMMSTLLHYAHGLADRIVALP